MIVKQHQEPDYHNPDFKLADNDKLKMEWYIVCDKCDFYITTLLVENPRYFSQKPTEDKYGTDSIIFIKGLIKRIERLLIGLNYSIRRIDTLSSSESSIVESCGIVIGDKHICKSCWSETKLKTEDIKERIELLRKGDTK